MAGSGDIRVTITLGGDEKIFSQLKRLDNEFRAAGKQASVSFGQGAAGVKVFETSVGGLITKLGGLAAAFISVRSVIGFAKDSLREFGEAEAAANKLSAALRGSGQESLRATKAVQAYANELAKTTLATDDQLVAVAAQIESLTKLSGDQLPKAIRATVQLAAVTGQDLPEAAKSVAKAINGQTGALTRLGVELPKNVRGIEALNAVLAATPQGMEIAQAATEGLTGQTTQAAKAWSEFKEAIGGAINAGLVESGVLQKLTKFVQDLTTQLGNVIDRLESLRQFARRQGALGVLGPLGAGAALFGADRALSDEGLAAFRAARQAANNLVPPEVVARSEALARNLSTVPDLLRGAGKAAADDLGEKGSKGIDRATASVAKLKDAIDNLAASERQRIQDLANRVPGGAAGGAGGIPGILQGAGFDRTEITAARLARLDAERAASLQQQVALIREAANRAGELGQILESDVTRGLSSALSVGLEFVANLKSGVSTADSLRGALAGVGQILASFGGVGGILGGALSGAAAGSFLGPPGAIIGGIGGLIGGLFGGGGDEEKQRKQAREFALGMDEVQDSIRKIVESGDFEEIAKIEALAREAGGGSRDALRALLEEITNATGVFFDAEQFIGAGAEALREAGFTQLAEQLETLMEGLAETTPEVVDRFAQLLQVLQDSADISGLLGLSPGEASADLQRRISEAFPDFAGALFGPDFMADLAEIQTNLDAIFRVFLSGTEEQRQAADAWLLAMGLTRDQAEEIAKTVKAAADAEERDRLARQKQQAEQIQRLDRLRPSRVEARQQFATIPTTTQATITAEPVLAAMAGDIRVIKETLNLYEPRIEANTRQGGVSGAALNGFLGQQVLDEARRVS